MKIIFDIAKAELKQMFYSPVAWLVLIFYTLQVGISYVNMSDSIVSHYTFGKWLSPGITGYIFSGIFGIFKKAQDSLFVLIPLLTMGLMSKEYSSGTIKLLYCAPVKTRELVLGKFLSMVIFGLIIAVYLSLIMVHASFTIKDYQLYHVMTGILGVFLLICTYSAVGLFMSSLTKYQVIAAVLTIATLGGLIAIDGVWEQYEIIREMTWWLSLGGRTADFTNGLICSDDIVYFIMVPTAFILFTIFKVNGDRVKGNKLVNFSKYIAVIVGLCVVGYASSRPSTLLYYDTTDAKTNTLPPATQKLISELDGPVVATLYMNILGETRMSYNYDFRFYKKFVRFMPDLKFKSVYYYDSVYNSAAKIYTQYPGMSNRDIMKEVVRLNRRDTSEVLSPEEVAKMVDLKGEPMHRVRELVDAKGNKVLLRLYNEYFPHPKEQEYTGALYNLIYGAPNIVFTTGHRELSPTSRGDRGYNTIFSEKTFRYALINQGFAVNAAPITAAMCDSTDYMVIADPQSEFTQQEMNDIDNYIAKGGDLIILTDIGHTDAISKLLSKFGVKCNPEPLYSNSESYDKEIVECRVSPEVKSLDALSLRDMASTGKGVACNGVLSLDYSEVKDGFVVTPLLVGRDAVSSSDKVTALTLEREINNQRQKIVIFGDANLFTNIEVSYNRNDVVSSNVPLLHGVFSWLTDDKLPANHPRAIPPDDDYYMRKTGGFYTRLFFIWFLPLTFLSFFEVIWVRRRSK